jgi:hypothetical protein
VSPLQAIPLPEMLVVGIVVIFACTCGVAAALLGLDLGRLRPPRGRRYPLLERQKDIAAGLGWRWERWLAFRGACVILGVLIAWWTGIVLLYAVAPIAGWAGTGFAFSGVAANRRLRMERAFLGELRNLRDRMAVSNQSLDTALQEMGRRPSAELAVVFAPLSDRGSTLANVVEMGRRARSPIVEAAVAVFIWARSRSSEFLIQSIDSVLLPVGEAQIALEEERMTTLSQQRAVTVAMAALLGVMLFLVLRIDSLRAFYQSFVGQIWLLVAFGVFALLVAVLGALVRQRGWTRWELVRLADEQERLGG